MNMILPDGDIDRVEVLDIKRYSDMFGLDAFINNFIPIQMNVLRIVINKINVDHDYAKYMKVDETKLLNE